MFGRNKTYTLKKKLFFSLLALISLSCAALFPQSRALLSSSIVQPNPTENQKNLPNDWNNVLDVYSKQIQTIQKSTDILESQLQDLYKQRENLGRTITLKQNLLTGIIQRGEGEGIQNKESQAVIEGLQTEIKNLSGTAQALDVKITDIYTKIGRYSTEMHEVSQSLHMYEEIIRYGQSSQ